MSIVNPKQYIQSARLNGYKDTAYAIAEITDNSIQAGAYNVEIIIVENNSRNITEIAIADNGCGMSPELLHFALSFGESGRTKDKYGNLEGKDTKGMGKFGMGLPNSSVSQCKRVEVFSWQHPHQCYFSYLDIDEINEGQFTDLPVPIKKAIPEHLEDNFLEGSLPKSGTIVRWTKLDKLRWKRSKTLFDKSEFEIGRMYRRFLSDNRVRVQFKVINEFGTLLNNSLLREGLVKANDPLYITEESREIPGLPIITGLNKTAFVKFEDTSESDEDTKNFGVKYKGKFIEIPIRTSYLRPEIAERIKQTMTHSSIGDTPFGKECAKNFGLSIMRADREIELVTKEFFNKDDFYTGRFIGVEIDIPPELDEVFGVTNNKQHANDLKDVTTTEYFDGDKLLDRDTPIIESLINGGDDEGAVLYQVSRMLKKMIDNVKKQRKKVIPSLNKVKTDTPNATQDDIISSRITAQIHKRAQQKGLVAAEEPDYNSFKKQLITERNIDEDTASSITSTLRALNSRVNFQYEQTTLDCFFDVENIQGITTITINPEHGVYRELYSNLNEEGKILFKLIIGAWATYEEEQTRDSNKAKIKRIRTEWSELIEEFFDEIYVSKDDD
jgi:hypothetical protein